MNSAVLPVRKVAYDVQAAAVGDISSMTAEQYMSWVSQQSQEMPEVVRVHVDVSRHARQTKYMPEIEEIRTCPDNLRPTTEWVQDVLTTFSQLRKILSALSDANEHENESKSTIRAVSVPAMKDSRGWMAFCLGIDVPAEEEEGEEEEMETGSVSSLSSVQEQDEEQEVELYIEKDLEEDGCVLEQKAGVGVGSDVKAETEVMRSKKKRLLAWLDAEAEMQAQTPTYTQAENQDTAGIGATAKACTYTEAGGRAKVRARIVDLPAPIIPNLKNIPDTLPSRWKGLRNQQPTTALLLQFDQVLTQRLLAMHTDWLCDTTVILTVAATTTTQEESLIDSHAEMEQYITESRGQWLYGLLARLEKPLYQDTAAVIRQLYRRCCELRSCLGAKTKSTHGSALDANASANYEADIAALNVLISITGIYFRQSEEGMMTSEARAGAGLSDAISESGDSESDSDSDKE